MRSRIFMDSGIFIAALSRADEWHAEATALFGGTTYVAHTSLLVVGETYAWFLHRHGGEAARTFRKFVASLDGLSILEITLDHHREVVSMLDRLRGSRLTYVDASSLCFIEQHRFRRVWGTDHHLGLTGAEVVPA